MGKLGQRKSKPEVDGAARVRAAAETIALPALALLSHDFAIFAACYAAGRGFAGVVKAQDLRAALDGVRFTVDRVKDRIRRERDVRPQELQSFVEHPATLKLLAQARDDWAVAQMRSNLARLAAIVANRASRPDSAIEEDLTMARAAVDLPDVGVALLVFMVGRAHADVERERTTGEAQQVPYGHTMLSDFVDKQGFKGPSDLAALSAAVAQIERHGLVFELNLGEVGGTPFRGIAWDDGQREWYQNRRLAPTDWGSEFVKRVREADAPPAAER